MKYFVWNLVSVFVAAAILLVPLPGCTNARMAQITSIGKTAEVTCYSGGQVYYHGFSTGKVSTEQGSDGWFFQEQGSNRLIRISGSCVVKN